MRAFSKATHIFFIKNISVYAIFNDQSFNDMLTNDIISFEQLGPGCFLGGGHSWRYHCITKAGVQANLDLNCLYSLNTFKPDAALTYQCG